MRTIIAFRHGDTKYTGVEPDLTEKGVAQISAAAESIHRYICASSVSTVGIVSSPAARALGSAGIVADRIGFSRSQIMQDQRLRNADIFDKERAGKLFQKLMSSKGDYCPYRKEPEYEYGDIVEKRSAIQARFGDYLQECFARHLSDGLPDVLICPSHYEVLWKLAMQLDYPQLVHGELIYVKLYDKSNGTLPLEIRFRNKGRFLTVPPNMLWKFWDLL